jgi:sugar/nucleoside kinase (ribokinase family)
VNGAAAAIAATCLLPVVMIDDPRAAAPLAAALELQTAVEYGAAHGALAMTTPGDTSVASLAEVEALARGGGARVQR